MIYSGRNISLSARNTYPADKDRSGTTILLVPLMHGAF